MKFEVGSKVRVLDTDQVTEVIEIYNCACCNQTVYSCEDGQGYEENELEWAK